MVAGAVIGGSLVSAGASAYSANKAADAQERAYDDASQVRREIYQQNREDYQPYREVGTTALNQLAAMYGASQNEEGGGAPAPNYDAFYQSPDYQFAYDEGMRALKQGLASRGLGTPDRSGKGMKELVRFGQGMASQQLGNYKSTLASLAGVGQSATQDVARQGFNLGQSVSGDIIGAGDSRASSYLNRGAAISGLAGDVTDAYAMNKMGYFG